MKKIKTRKLNDICYLLGIDKENNEKTYLVAPSWDCSWYWDFGYIREYSRNDVELHTHFDSLFLKENIFYSFKDFFSETVLTDDEIWQLLGYMQEFYIMKKYAELLQYGNHITSKAKNILEEKNEKENQKEVYRINKIILPELFKKIDKLLTESEE